MKKNKNKPKIIYLNDKPLNKYLEIDINKKQNTYVVKNDPNPPEIKGRFKWYKKLPKRQRRYFWMAIAHVIGIFIVIIVFCCVFFIH